MPAISQSPPRRSTLRDALRTSRKLIWGLVLGVSTVFAVFIAAASGLSLLSSNGTVHRVTPEAEVATERRLQRDAAQGLADAYNRLQARYAAWSVDEDELFQLALAHVAEESTVSIEQLQTTLADFALAVEANPDAEALDEALVDFAERNFECADSIATGLPEASEAPEAPEERRELLRMRGQCLLASEDHERAVDMFQAALGSTRRVDAPEAWADLQYRIGEAAALSGEVTGLLAAVLAFESALEVFDQDQWTTKRAMALNELAACQGKFLLFGSDGEIGTSAPVARFEEVIEAHRAAAEIFYSSSEWRLWAHAKADLARVLIRAGADGSAGTHSFSAEQPEILDDQHLFQAASGLRRALKIQEGTEHPAEVERTRLALVEILFLRALLCMDDRKATLFYECSHEYDQAFVRLAGQPRAYAWYRLAHSKAMNWRRMADTQEDPVEVQLLEEALETEISIAEYFSDNTDQNAQMHSQHWVAWSEMCLVDVLVELDGPRDRQEELLADAERRLRRVLTEPDDARPPHSRMPAQQNLAGVLHRRANLRSGSERTRLLDEAIQEAERYVEIYGSQMAASEKEGIASWIEFMESDLMESE